MLDPWAIGAAVGGRHILPGANRLPDRNMLERLRVVGKSRHNGRQQLPVARGVLQTKFAASSVPPVRVYAAIFG